MKKHPHDGVPRWIAVLLGSALAVSIAVSLFFAHEYLLLREMIGVRESGIRGFVAHLSPTESSWHCERSWFTALPRLISGPEFCLK